MKVKLLLPALLLATQLHASIIELPQGTQIWQVNGYTRSLHFFDEATVVPLSGSPTDHGWVSLYGELNGGTLFDTDLFSLTPTSTANLWWNFNDSGFKLLFVVVNDGEADGKIYQLNGLNTIDNEDLILSPFDNKPIHTISLYGHVPNRPIPDSGATLLLFVVALFGLVLYDKKTTQLLERIFIRRHGRKAAEL